MMELVKINNSKYDEYEALLLERDQAAKEAGQIWTAYILEFGQLMAEVYEEKLDCIKKKKALSFYQAAINRGEAIDQDAMQKQLDREMMAYYANLKRMQEDNEKCKNAGTSTDYEVQRSKKLYRILAKLIHPDINPETDRSEVLLNLWQRVVTAYGHNNVKELSELEVLVRKALKDMAFGEIEINIPEIDEKIEALKAEIIDIRNTEPYTHKNLLDNPEAVHKKKDELQKERESYRKYNNELDEVIKNMLMSAGVTIKWQMN